MITDGIKIAECDDIEIGVSDGEVFQDFFDHVFGLAVGIGEFDAGWHGLNTLFDTLVAIDGGGGGKDDVLDVMVLHGLEEVDSASNIVVVVTERLFDRFGDGFKAGKMDDKVEIGAREDSIEGFKIEKIDFMENGLGVCDLLDFV